MTFYERIQKRLALLSKRGVPADMLSDSGIARTCKFSRTLINSYKDKPVKGMMAGDKAVRLADFLGCEIRWLVTGKGPEERRLTQDETEVLELYQRVGDDRRHMILALARLLAQPAEESIPLLEAPRHLLEAPRERDDDANEGVA